VQFANRTSFGEYMRSQTASTLIVYEKKQPSQLAPVSAVFLYDCYPDSASRSA